MPYPGIIMTFFAVNNISDNSLESIAITSPWSWADSDEEVDSVPNPPAITDIKLRFMALHII